MVSGNRSLPSKSFWNRSKEVRIPDWEKYGPHSELLFFLMRKEAVVFSNEVPFKPVVRADTLKACAQLCLHLLAAESEAGSSGSQSPNLGDMWRHSCPKSPEWISSCSASETSLGCEVYEHNNACRAIEVIGQDWSSEVVALFLEDWEAGEGCFELPHGHGPSLSEMRDACWDSSSAVLAARLLHFAYYLVHFLNVSLGKLLRSHRLHLKMLRFAFRAKSL